MTVSFVFPFGWKEINKGGKRRKRTISQQQGERERKRGQLLTISSTLWHWSLATTTSDTDTVDDIALLGLVAQATSLVGSRGSRGAVDDFQLSELY